jgi:hypothetical protein
MSLRKFVAAVSIAAGLVVVSPTVAVANTVSADRSVNYVSVARGTTLQDCNIQRSVLRAGLANEGRTIVSDTGCQKIKSSSPGGIQYQARVVWR